MTYYKRKFSKKMLESDEGESLMVWVESMEAQLPKLKGLFHIPNEGKRSPWIGASLKRQGLKKGFPDYLLLTPSLGYHGLVFEMKSIERFKKKDNGTSKEQRDWLNHLHNEGYLTAVTEGWIGSAKVLYYYLTGKQLAL